MLAIGLLLSLIVLIAVRLHERRRDHRLPPGPRRLPLIGNLHQAPIDFPFLTYARWTQQYGPIYSVQFGKDTIVVLGTPDAAEGVLNKRSTIYSNRPRLVMAGECLTKGMHTLLRQYDPKLRLIQRMVGRAVNESASQEYRPQQDLESKQLMKELLLTGDFDTSFKRYAASAIYSVMYGFRVTSPHDKSFVENYEVLGNQVKALRVGHWIVDAIPILNYLPPFLAPWKRTAERYYEMESRLYAKDLDHGLQAREENIAQKLSTSNAALETTAGQLNWAVLAALNHPEKTRAAQAELDSVVGVQRLPGFEDRERLPYVNAFIMEIMRWRHITPAGVPHAAAEDDEYLGYRIPKGAIVIGNLWSINMDVSIYGDPQNFRPERWLENPKLPQHPWGFGRRICPGRHIAVNSLFIAIARMLWAFDIEPAYVDGVRQEVDDMEMTSELTSKPKPFSVAFKPRGRRAVSLIEED
ncbi:putative O-methylsterigmatocystin oxidoreductase [Rhizodiscina lignyota]|uniref:O-methylsterigmatocystin oxidoreductase n=1 Tax=Rhizodiscina lignyota TaxID=1504668 RepID=A0A9P4IJ03_9PEZI|nr:putative O-methylsterigmatocystin oxidoreductase [Rhizodiscina lignyota]